VNLCIDRYKIQRFEELKLHSEIGRDKQNEAHFEI